MKKILLPLAVAIVSSGAAQNKMTPELLWKLGRVAGLGISKDKQYVIYAVNQPDVQGNTSSSKYYKIPEVPRTYPDIFFGKLYRQHAHDGKTGSNDHHL